MLTGRPPFEGATSLATAGLRLTDDPPRPGTLRGGIPRDLEAVVMRAMARDPHDRFESASGMIAALDRCAAGRGEPVGPATVHRQEPAPSSFRSWVLVPLVLVGLAVVAIVVGLLIGRIELGGPLGVRGAGPDPTPAAAAEPLPIGAVTTYDPPPGDGSEHDESLPAVIDGDPLTAWTTEGYESADLGGAKPGVGLVLDLGSAREISELRITSSLPGWTFELQGSGDAVTFSEPLVAEGTTSFTATDETVIRPDDATHRYLMIWITGLVPDKEGDEYRAGVAEVEVLGG
jgi:hypothetical protein